jgi:plasmid stabilization system protein ParE
VSRFFLSADARRDLEDFEADMDQLTTAAATRIALALQEMLNNIAENPYRGSPQSFLTRLIGEEARSRLVFPYRVYYSTGRGSPEIIAIIHGARDQAGILARRFQ